MVVKYERDDPDRDESARKTGFEITTINEQKIGAARAVISAVMSGNGSKPFESGNDIYGSLDAFVDHVIALNALENKNGSGPRFIEMAHDKLMIGGEKIAWLECLPDTSTKPSLLFLHGGGAATKERTLYLAHELAQIGIGSVLFDFSGHGESTGKSIESTLEKRVKEACEVYKNKLDPRRRLGIVASSMGGYVALKMIERQINVGFVALFSPAVYSDDAFSQRFKNPDGTDGRFDSRTARIFCTLSI
jgi:hypothetical protein